MSVVDEQRSGRARIRPVVLCGGSGTRLWPLSRSEQPKQLVSVSHSTSMLQQTVARIAAPLFDQPILVTGEDHRWLVRDQVEEAGAAPLALILEPEGRNTAAAIALAAHAAMAEDPEAVLLVLPSDHLIADEGAFRKAVERGWSAATDGRLVTFGLAPTRPETGYGYIEAGEPLDAQGAGLAQVASFVEKPDAARAASLCSDGKHYWNGGIFLMRAAAYLEELERHAPDVAKACADAMASAERDGAFIRPGRAFLESPSISIDYAVMEKTSRAAVVVGVDMGWSDVGSWDAVWEVGSKDAQGNVLVGPTLVADCRNSLFRTETDQMIVAVGAEDMVLVATRDAILLVPRERSQDVKLAVEQLVRSNSDKHRSQPRVHRPWGTYETVDRGERFQTKRIVVKPGAQLSLQLHHHRSEHWIVVRGTAKVTIGDRVTILHENESTFIPIGERHRLENPGKIPLELIEVQCGTYLGEDDIVRIDDRYGRDVKLST